MTFASETARTVYERTYRRERPDGSLETWPETVERVVDANLRLVPPRYIEAGERQALINEIGRFRILPAGRHLRAGGVSDFALNNCWAAGWDPAEPARHFTFTLLRLAEGGGVGSNYSQRYFEQYPLVWTAPVVHIVCDPAHPDYAELLAAGLISSEYDPTWPGAYPVEDSREGWAAALAELIRVAHDPTTEDRSQVFDVGRVRAKGAALRAFGGTASGPTPFARMLVEVGRTLSSAVGYRLDGMDAMAIDHSIAACIMSGGVRRSARMSIKHWADLDIEFFINAKRDQSDHWTTNISVEVDDAFFEALDRDDERAIWVLRQLAAAALSNGEPGFWNSSLSAEGEVDGVYTTNPCGEATLTAWEPCTLGSINLGAFVNGYGDVEYESLDEAHRLLVRFLIRATFATVADPQSQAAIERYRRIGVGHTGLADHLAMRGIWYSSASTDTRVAYLLQSLAQVVDKAAADYSNELRIPRPIKTRAVAPTGTISKLAGVSGEGIHAPFSPYFIRRVRFSTVAADEVQQMERYAAAGYYIEPCRYAPNTGVVEIPTLDPLADRIDCLSNFESAADLTLPQQLDVQVLYQRLWADQAVSYTASIRPEQYTVSELMRILREYMPRLKGSTIFPETSRDQAPYERIDEDEFLLRSNGLTFETDTGYDEWCASGACPI
ncbi:ribonucleoside-triphosphate reductase, adenosylcobalamin-dependent [Embleya hyalina]|uniref:Adenosylcobalamin-dependent ribonucleoside-triphosphate reductase n=1 Tax=Embleya hyalina TaxID=516124 RepID=A0A401YZ62_9ACTN|nr:ribonucleoside-triphosphate reductase, adenosylcobalamin-dependent [Embleya hyalina]GCD99840.1 ribonucleoside-diphosphate reductase, adenosylcobalamin-dependent [Embleya hyalina]